MMLEAGIDREDCPAPIHRDRTNQNVQDRHRHASAPEFVVGFGCFFIIRSTWNDVGKGAQRRAAFPF
ncbi:MAG: hypothetical protein WA857_17245 [Candidatus Acidiferrum sp.]